MNVQIHVPTLNEEDTIRETLESLAQQRRVRNGEVSIIVLDSISEDNTRKIAQDIADVVLTTPGGKLTARDAGLQKFDVNIVAAADAGDIYPKGWLDSLVEPFDNENVVATQGPSWPRGNLLYTKEAMINTIKRFGILQGGNSAIRKEAYKQIGGFDTNIDQSNRMKVIREEEIRLRRKLEGVGKVVFVREAVAYKSQRRFKSPQFIQKIIRRERM